MKKLDAGDPEAKSHDVVAANMERLKAIFPELITEGSDGAAVNVDVLKDLVGDATVTDCDEKYGLNWHGKRRARRLALTPSTGTLRPCPEDSVDWDTTQNLMIEGDNLEVLKLLQKSYAGKVKLIYIDPPYNTGKDFVYPDDFKDSIRNYMELTGQLEGGAKISSNTEVSGRFHTDWLNMIYPRLRLARELLRPDGALFMTIDDGEIDNLIRVTSEVFGEENFVGIIAVRVNPRGRHLDRYLAKTHDYVVVFAKDAENPKSIRGVAKSEEMLSEYNREDERGRYRDIGLRNRNQAFNPTTRPNLYYPLFVNPANGEVSTQRDAHFSDEVVPETRDGVKTCWTWGRDKVMSESDRLIARRRDDGSWRVFRKDYLEDEDGNSARTLSKSLWLDKEFTNDYGRKSIKSLFGSAVMDFPKSPHLLQRIVEIGSSSGDLVLDFFAGSGTTGHAVLTQNQAEHAERRFMMVQLPEALDPTDNAQSLAAKLCDELGRPRSLAELTKERLRRAAQKIKNDNPFFAGDLGFRVFKLASSNIRTWNPDPDDLDQTLLNSVEHLKDGRTEADVLYELLLKLGLDLCVPIETRIFAENKVHSVGGGVLFACLTESITMDEVEDLAEGIIEWHEELDPAGDVTCVFRDSAFGDDVAKSNMAAILEQHGIENVRSL